MYLAVFDESKNSSNHPNFYVGGFFIHVEHLEKVETTIRDIQDSFFGKATDLKKREIHGEHLYHGKGNFKNKPICDRLLIAEKLLKSLSNANAVFRIVDVDTVAHCKKYSNPKPPYYFGLMLFQEEFARFLDERDSYGFMIGDRDKDVEEGALEEFNEFKLKGRTSYIMGRPVDRISALAFKPSHCSLIVQAADLICYLHRNHKSRKSEDKWHERQFKKLWIDFKNEIDGKVRNWAPGKTIPKVVSF